MREFEIETAVPDRRYNLDAVRGHLSVEWELEDVKNAMEAHARRFSTKLTLAIFEDVTGVDAHRIEVRSLPRRYYGQLIAAYCIEILMRPNRVTQNAHRR
jgi:hypothetical protein